MRISSISNCNCNCSRNEIQKSNKNQSFGNLYINEETYKAVQNKLGNNEEAFKAFVEKAKELSKIKLNINEILHMPDIYRLFTESTFLAWPFVGNEEAKKECGDKLINEFIDLIGEEQANDYSFEFKPVTWYPALGYEFYGKGVSKSDHDIIQENMTEVTEDVMQNSTKLVGSTIGKYNPNQYENYYVFGDKVGCQVCLPKDLKTAVGLAIYRNLMFVLQNNHKKIYQEQENQQATIQ